MSNDNIHMNEPPQPTWFYQEQPTSIGAFIVNAVYVYTSVVTGDSQPSGLGRALSYSPSGTGAKYVYSSVVGK